MIHILPLFLRRIAFILKTTSTKPLEISRMLHEMVSYLRSEPDENFSIDSYHNVPLNMNATALKNLETKEGDWVKNKILESHPELSQTGKAGLKNVNFIYIVSQVIIRVIMVFMSIESINPHLKKEIRDFFLKFSKIWETTDVHNLRSDHLYDIFRGKSVKDAKENLIHKMTASAELIQEIAPKLE